MGDVLLSTPAIRAFKRSFPKVPLDVLVERIPAQPLQNNPDIDQIIIAPNRGSPLPKFLPLIRTLRANRYHTVVDFQSTPGSALLTKLTGAPNRIGYDRRYRTWAYRIAVIPETAPNYSSASKFKLLEPLGVLPPASTDKYALLPNLFPSETDNSAAANFLRDNGIVEGTPIIGLAPYCRRSWRMWSVDNWMQLIKAYSRLRRPIWLLFAAPNERELLTEFENLPDASVLWAGQDHLLKTAALMKHCRAVVGGENGLLHLAVAAGIPTFSIFCGKDEPGRWVPPGMIRHAAVDLRGSEPTDPADAALMLDMFLSYR